MKKQLLIVSALLSFAGTAQTFSDNFDTYTAGQYMANQSGGNWTTWGNLPGTTQDVLVSSADSKSAPNSIYLTSTANGGGPTDLVKKFGAAMTTGQFSLEFNLKVPTGKAGYFNLQKNLVVGEYALDCFFHDDGTIKITTPDGGYTYTGTYTQNVWFDFRLDINFNTNKWEVFFDNVSQAVFSNGVNQVAGIDIYPVDETAPYTSAFYLDDFQYTFTPFTPANFDAAVTGITYDKGNIAGNSVTPKITVRNLGTTPITSFDVDVVYNGITKSASYSGLNIVSLASTTVTLTGDHLLAAGSHNMVATISNINGMSADDDPSDDSKPFSVNPTVPATGKMVVSEEATGTWCQYCPKGAVAMGQMEQKYSDYWIGIAVHNTNGAPADPMTVSEYDAGVVGYITGFPSVLVDRNTVVDPLVMEADILNRLVVAPKATIKNGATWDASTRQLNISVTANLTAAVSSNYKLGIVITEDDVTGTTSGYHQVNAFAGGGLGPMGGFESLPNPVPASQMHFDHVARLIEPSFRGFPNSFPSGGNAGESHTVTLSVTIPAEWDETKLSIVGLLFNTNNVIDNAGKATITEAVANGYVAGTNVNASIKENLATPTLQIFPNPAHDAATIAVTLQKESTATVRIMDLSGKEISSRNYGSMNGASTIDVNTANFVPGVYIVELVLDTETIKSRLVVE